MKKNKKWFTLIEIVLVIALIWILMVWLSRINFNNNLNKQKFEDFNNQIVTNIETVRNNALNWKWVLSGGNLINPTKFNINLTLTAMTTWHGLSYNNLLNEVNVSFNNINKITSIKCANLDWTNEINTTPVNNLKLDFNGKDVETSCWSLNNKIWKLIKIRTSAWSFTKEITFNTVTWTITKK